MVFRCWPPTRGRIPSIPVRPAPAVRPYGDVYSRQLGANANRGPSDFDIRNSASVALTYDIPSAKANKFIRFHFPGMVHREYLSGSLRSTCECELLPPLI